MLSEGYLHPPKAFSESTLNRDSIGESERYVLHQPEVYKQKHRKKGKFFLFD